jgi:exopolysaccharide biosynthesis polyprenyl glycosylphosphotransferase
MRVRAAFIPILNPMKTTDRFVREGIRHRLIIASFVGDVLVVALALLASYGLKFNTAFRNFGIPTDSMTVDQYAGHIVMGVTLLIGILANARLYSPAYAHALRRHARIIGQACVVWTLVYLSVLLILKVNPSVSRLYCVLGGVFSMAGLWAWRKLLSVATQHFHLASRMKQNVLFVGWSEESARMLDTMQAHPEHSYNVIGVIPKQGWTGEVQPPVELPQLGDFQDIEEILAEHQVEIVMLTDIGIPKHELLHIAIACEKAMVEFKLIPNVFQVFVSGLSLENLGGIPVLGISRLPLHSIFNQWTKRFVDVLGSLCGLVLGLPMIALCAALIKLEDGGPAFYRQCRTGRNGKDFWIYKLRSMRLDSEASGAPGWTVKGDSRCLRVGTFMRKWNLDEVPQFWNVLRGEMSLVGPRPERPELIERFKHEILHYNARHNIKPGITGWAQVHGLRGDTDLGQRIKFDIHYIENWNLFLDLQIMAMTFFRRENAC